MAKKTILDYSNKFFQGTKKADTIVLKGGKHRILTGSGNDQIIIDLPNELQPESEWERKYTGEQVTIATEAFPKISDSIVYIGKGEGNTKITFTDNIKKKLSGSSNPVYMPQLNFEEGAEISYSLELKDNAKYNKNYEKALKYMTKVLAKNQDFESIEPPKDVADFMKEGQTSFNLVITAKWGKKVSKVTIENFIESERSEMGSPENLEIRDIFSKGVGSLQISIGTEAPFSFSDSISDLDFEVKGVTLTSKTLNLLTKYEKAIEKYCIKQFLNTDDINVIKKLKKQLTLSQMSILMYKMFPTQFAGMSGVHNIFSVNKGNSVVSAGDSLKNTINIGKKAKITVVKACEGQDNFNIDNLNNTTYITDGGSNLAAANNITIKNANANDFHAIIMPENYTGSADNYINNDLSNIAFQNTKGINTYSKANIDMSNEMTAELTMLTSVKGIITTLDKDDPYFYDNGFFNKNSKFEILGKPEKGAGTIEINDIKNFVRAEYYLLDEWNTQNKTWFIEHSSESCKLSPMALLYSGDKVINMIMKENGITSKKAKTAFKKEFQAKKAELLNIYKSCYLGTSGNNSYTFGKKGGMAYSGSGNDTFTFKGKMSDAKIVEGTPDSKYTEIYSNLKLGEADKFVFTDYSFENGDLRWSSSNSYWDGVTFETVDYNKKGQLVGTHCVDYEYNTEDPNDLYTLTVKDKKRTYELSAKLGTSDIDLTTKADNKKNHIIFNFENGESGPIKITSNGQYNRFYMNYNVDYVNNNKNTHDYLSLAEGNDTIIVSQYNKNTSLTASDYYYSEPNTDYDSFELTNISNKDMNNMRFLFSVNKDGDYDLSKLCFTDKANFKASNLYSCTGFEGTYAFKTGINLRDIENVKIGDKTIVYQKQVAPTAYSFETDNYNWLNQVVEKVAGWLSNSKTYDSTDAVFESGNTKDINSLLKVYSSVKVDMTGF